MSTAARSDSSQYQLCANLHVAECNWLVKVMRTSCGALVHADTPVLPYGIGDATIGIATVPLPELLATLGG